MTPLDMIFSMVCRLEAGASSMAALEKDRKTSVTKAEVCAIYDRHAQHLGMLRLALEAYIDMVSLDAAEVTQTGSRIESPSVNEEPF